MNQHKGRDEHLFDPGPKRILALDGGGVRGALTLGYLARIEGLLRRRAGGNPALRLCDYFDLIAGTSTGAIIAAALAMRYSVAEIEAFYRSLADEAFRRPPWRLGVWGAKFASEPLDELMREIFDDITLGSKRLCTGLVVIAKRLDTCSPWVIHNNPRGKYFDSPEGRWVPNRDFLLREVLRASTAAPHYFQPEVIEVAKGTEGVFIDGGVSPHNNPALKALMVATMEGYGLDWPSGEEQLLLISVGTGRHRLGNEPRALLNMPALQMTGQALLSMMDDCDALVQTLLQWMSCSPTAQVIDGEMGSVRDEVLGDIAPLLSYLRYNVILDADWFRDVLGISYEGRSLADLFAMDCSENVADLMAVGMDAAAVQIKDSHFPAAFDLQ